MLPPWTRLRSSSCPRLRILLKPLLCPSPCEDAVTRDGRTKMAPVLPALAGRDGGGTRALSPPPGAHPALRLPSRLQLCRTLPGRACDGASPPSVSPCVIEGEALSSHPPKAPSISSATLPPPAAGCLAKEADGKREQQTPKMCHCAKCFQTLQDVTVSQFQFIRRRGEDAVTSKRSFSL